MYNTDHREDTSLLAETWETFASSRDLNPEKRLLVAVLENAIKSYRTFRFTGGRRVMKVEEWIFSDDDNDTFSFRSICDILGLSPSRIRQLLRTWPTTINRPT